MSGLRAVVMLLVTTVLACEPFEGTIVDPDGEGTPVTLGASPAGLSVTLLGPCATCAFEPRLYTRGTSIAASDIIEFDATPGGAYVLKTDDMGTLGAESTLWLNGTKLKTGTGEQQQDVALNAHNTLEVRLTGKPGSKLLVKISRDIAAVVVTPATARGKIPDTQQFTAVARDRNNVAIPNVTFTWTSGNQTIATIGASNGLARTVGPRHDNVPFSYHTISTGEGPVQIVAVANGTDKQGSATWTVVTGFVYSTFQASLPLNSPNRSARPQPQAHRWDEARLNQMFATCVDEASNTEWQEQPLLLPDRLFRQCYPVLELGTPTRTLLVPATPLTPPIYSFGAQVNVGLYGRYCGGGHPGETFWGYATGGSYPPKDAIDAICMEHDRSEALHEIPAEQALKAACIVRFGIESEILTEEGVPVPKGSSRWNEFWSRYLSMAVARQHWLTETVVCAGPIYDAFLAERGLTAP